MTIAFHSDHPVGRSTRTRRLHILRPDGKYAGRESECGVACHPGLRANPVLIDPMPACPPPGLTWCPACIGHLAARVGLLDRMAGRLAVACRTTAADRADIALDDVHKRLDDGAGEI